MYVYIYICIYIYIYIYIIYGLVWTKSVKASMCLEYLRDKKKKILTGYKIV